MRNVPKSSEAGLRPAFCFTLAKNAEQAAPAAVTGPSRALCSA